MLSVRSAGQGPQEPQDGAIDWGVFGVIVIGVVFVWELLKWFGKAFCRSLTCHVSHVPRQLHEPFAEDAVSDEERETERRAEREETLRQRRVGQSVRHPEPDQEPAPSRMAFGQPRNPPMTQYADDAIAVWDLAEVAFEANQRGMFRFASKPSRCYQSSLGASSQSANGQRTKTWSGFLGWDCKLASSPAACHRKTRQLPVGSRPLGLDKMACSRTSPVV